MAVTADLLFGSPVPGNADLLFGATGAGTNGAAATFQVGLPPLGMVVQAAHVYAAVPAIALPPLGMAVVASWDTRTERPLASRVVAPHQQGNPAPSPDLAARHQQSVPRQSGVVPRHTDAISAGYAPQPLRHRDAAHVQQTTAPRHQDGAPARSSRAAAHQDATRLRRQILARHQDGAGLRTHRATLHQDAERQRRTVATRMQAAQPARLALTDAYGPARISGRWLTGDHQDAIRPPIGRYALPPIVPPQPPRWSPSADLLFCQAFQRSGDLLFGWMRAGAVIPIREFYLVINTVTLVRADTAVPVQNRQFSARLDVDSWTWSWSATLPASEFNAVRSPALGEQVELIATLNGTPLHLVVEKIGRARRFGDGWVMASGRGRAAWLADPHAAIETRSNAQARTARQLLEDALTINGVSIGWTVDWRITDWLVPAGAWSHQGTYKDAATRIAEAGGAYIQAHDTAQTLIVLPRYPAAPWNWGPLVPDIQLSEAVCEVENIEWMDRPVYNAVYVTGGATGGRHDRILRTGTAGDRVAPQIVDPLATAAEMTRQRGLAALSDTGRQAHISLRLPVLPETGLITPGKLIRYVENGTSRLGLSRSIEVAHDWPQLWQTIQVETHELEPV